MGPVAGLTPSTTNMDEPQGFCRSNRSPEFPKAPELAVGLRIFSRDNAKAPLDFAALNDNL